MVTQSHEKLMHVDLGSTPGFVPRNYVVLEKLFKFTESQDPNVYNGDCGGLKMAAFSSTPPIKKWSLFSHV